MDYLLFLLVGGLLVANIPLLQRLLSIEEFFLGLQRGLARGMEMRGGRKRKEERKKGEKK